MGGYGDIFYTWKKIPTTRPVVTRRDPVIRVQDRSGYSQEHGCLRILLTWSWRFVFNGNSLSSTRALNRPGGKGRRSHEDLRIVTRKHNAKERGRQGRISLTCSAISVSSNDGMIRSMIDGQNYHFTWRTE